MSASLEGLANIGLSEVEKENIIEATKNKIDDLESQIARWTAHKAELTSEQQN